MFLSVSETIVDFINFYNYFSYNYHLFSLIMILIHNINLITFKIEDCLIMKFIIINSALNCYIYFRHFKFIIIYFGFLSIISYIGPYIYFILIKLF